MHCDQSTYEEFPSEHIRLLYDARWAIEGSFRKLKYTIGLSNFHSCRPDYIKQETWAKLIAYNMTETLINQTILKKGNTKYEYKVNISMAGQYPRLKKQLISENPNILYIVQHKTVSLTTIRPFLKQM